MTRLSPSAPGEANMASKGGLLSDLQLKQWIKAGKPISASDGGGLLFTLSAAGNAAWVLRYRYGNQRPEMTLGPYPAIGLSEARAMTLIKRAEIAQGKNPMAERRKAKVALAKDWTVRQLSKDYREKILVTLAKSTKVCYSRHLKRIENRFGSLGVPRDISEMCLNHKLTGVEGIYDQHTYYPERRQALLTWAQFLMDCAAGQECVVKEPPGLVE